MKAQLLAAFHQAIAACDPTARVAAVAPRAEVGIAIGKAALAMARGAKVDRGIIVSPVDGHVPGWTTIVSAHPFPDERSLEAGRAVRALVESAHDTVLALISGGASSLIEDPLIPLADFVATIRALMNAGAPIHELNVVRSALSSLKAGKLVEHCRARVTTLVASDIVGDPLALIGSGPTIVSEIDHGRARAILSSYQLPIPDVLHSPSQRIVRCDDRAELVLPMRAFAEAVRDATRLPLVEAPFTGLVEEVADALASPCVAWGEPTLRIPDDHGEGGRAQQLALELARRARGTARCALVMGTDGIDGPPPSKRPAPAGAYIDGATWDAIARAGIDPVRALARRDAGSALHAADALVVTGPTGVNHADIMVVT